MITRETGFTMHNPKAPYIAMRMDRKIPRDVTIKLRVSNGSAGYSLVEMLIAMVMFVLVIVAASSVFTSVLTNFKQQSKISETQVESIIGLELLRYDIEHAGYGLPWNLGGATFCEAVNDGNTLQNEMDYNDTNTTCTTSAAPRAIVSGDGNGIGTSDVLVIKAANVAGNRANRKWTSLGTGNIARTWDLDDARPETDDRVIVLTTIAGTRDLVTAGSFTARYSRGGAGVDDSLSNAGFAPDVNETRVVYGITNPANPVNTALRMPFNRADYYYKVPAGGSPARCAPNTGVLYKATVDQADGVSAGGGLSELPLIDCVADFQVVYRLDMDDDGQIGTSANADGSVVTSTEGASTVTVPATFADAALLRQRLKEVRVYVLAHEGQRDPNFTYVPTTYNPPAVPVNSVRVGPRDSTILGRDFDLTAITDWEDYRWKLYILVVKPISLS